MLKYNEKRRKKILAFLKTKQTYGATVKQVAYNTRLSIARAREMLVLLLALNVISRTGKGNKISPYRYYIVTNKAVSIVDSNG